MSDVFISYSFKDRQFVRRLYEALKRLKRNIWVDWAEIPPTAKWLEEIFAAIDAADSFVFLISPDSCRSETCKKEVAHAAASNKRLIPLLLYPVAPKDLPPPLAEIVI